MSADEPISPALMRPLIIALIPVLPAVIGGVVWITALGDRVEHNDTRLSLFEKTLTNYDTHGSRITNEIDARVRALEALNVEQNAQLRMHGDAINLINQHLAVFDERQRNAVAAVQAVGDKVDLNNRLIRDIAEQLGQRQPRPP
jgi:hypothetical protein